MVKRFITYLSLYFLLLCISSVNARSTKSQQLLTYEIRNNSTIVMIDRAVKGAIDEKGWSLEASSDSVPSVLRVVVGAGNSRTWSEIKYDRKRITLSKVDGGATLRKQGMRLVSKNSSMLLQQLIDQMIHNIELGESYVSNVNISTSIPTKKLRKIYIDTATKD